MKSLSFLLISVIGLSASANWKQSGSLEIYYRKLGISSTPEVSSESAGFDGNLKFDWSTRSKQFRFKSDLDFRTDYLSKDSVEQFQGNPSQFYLETKTGSVKWRAGYQTIIPEGPDLLNPADVIHSKNWIDPTNPEHLSSLGLSLSQEVDEWQWEAFFIPRQTEPVLPGDRSPWWPRNKRLPIESENAQFLVHQDTKYKILDPVDPNQALKNNFALRAGRKSESFEFQTVYYEGLSQDPNLLIASTLTLVQSDPFLIVQLDSPAELYPFYFKQRVAAGTFMIPRGSWAIRGGANWIKALGDDARLPGERSTSVLGIEKSFDTRKGMITTILQYQAQKRQNTDQISFMRSIFENAWSLGFRIPWGEETQFLGGVIYDTIGKSSVYRLNASRRLTDSLSFGLEGTLLQGPEETMLGLYDKYDRYGLSFTYHW